MNKPRKRYTTRVIALILLAIAAFYGFKYLLPDRLFPDRLLVDDNIVVDSLMLKAMTDSTYITDESGSDTLKISNNEANDPSLAKGGHKNLARFYAKLHELEKDSTKKVRIGYYGDSMNDGDFIVQDVRSLLQEEYGGVGVGFVGITSLSSGSRASIRHEHSNNWNTHSFVKKKTANSPFGIDGKVYYPNGDDTWVKYRAQGQSHSTSLYAPVLFYGRAEGDGRNASISVKLPRAAQPIRRELNSYKLLNTMKVSATVQNLDIQFHEADSVPIFGFSFDGGRGINVDNFSLRGNSGLPLTSLSVGMMNAFDKVLNYDLIILQYGANVLSSTTKSYNWYEKSMIKAIDNLHKCFPNADILVVSVGDKSTKVDNEMVTDPALNILLEAQRNYAMTTNSGFVDLYNLMGGEGAMVQWVKDKLAAKDYTHFSPTGSQKIGTLIYEEINKGYEKYKANSLKGN